MSIEQRDFFLFWLRVIPIVLAFATAVTCAHAGGKWRYWALVFALESVGIAFAIRINDWQLFYVVLFRNTSSLLCATRIYWLVTISRTNEMRKLFEQTEESDYPRIVVASKDPLTALKVMNELGKK